MNAKYERQLKKGVFEILVLKLLSEGEKYGYELLMELKERGGEMFAVKEGTLYPILYRLEDDGLASSRWSRREKRFPESIIQLPQKDAGSFQSLWSFGAALRKTYQGYWRKNDEPGKLSEGSRKISELQEGTEKQIRRDLEADICAASERGESWEEIRDRMGGPRELAQEFNENMGSGSTGSKMKRSTNIL